MFDFCFESYIQYLLDDDMSEMVEKNCRDLTDELLMAEECQVCSSDDVYRTFSGCCNNLLHKNHGRANQAFVRLTENAYSDSKSLPRGGLSSSTLPSPRKISSVVHRREEPVGDSTVTVMLMQFGQFLDHDITLTPEQGKNRKTFHSSNNLSTILTMSNN